MRVTTPSGNAEAAPRPRQAGPAVPADLTEALLTAKDFAALCRVTPKTVYRWIRDRQVESIRTPGRGVRVHPAEARKRLHLDPVRHQEDR
jgi:excisionase family DNA binding protein